MKITLQIVNLAILLGLSNALKKPIKAPNGDDYYPGRGCGGSSPIRYLSEVPHDATNKSLACTFVSP
jgi:hypothetical protein